MASALEERDKPGDPATIYPDGYFTTPNQFGGTYDQGTPMNISWFSNYSNSNLFIAQYGNDGNSKPIALGISASWYSWNIQAIPAPGIHNLSSPFHLRVVDAQGSPNSQAGGGIWSPGFYIEGTLPKSSTDADTSTTSAASSATSSVSATSSPTSTPSNFSSPPQDADSNGLSTGAKAGIGVGVSLGVIFIGIAIAALIILRKRQKNTNSSGLSPTLFEEHKHATEPLSEMGPPLPRQELDAINSYNGAYHPVPSELPAET